MRCHKPLLPCRACFLLNDDGEEVVQQAQSEVGILKDQRKEAEDQKHPGLQSVELVVGLWQKRHGVGDPDP